MAKGFELSSYIADMITGYSNQKKALADNVDAAKRASLANNAQALALYDQKKAVEATGDQFKEIQNKIKGAAGGIKGLADAVMGMVTAVAKSVAAVTAFTAAASPQAAAGLGDIFRIVAAQIGMALIPVVMRLVVWAGQLVDWFTGLSDTTQLVIAAVVAGIPILLAVGPAIGGIITAAVAILGPFSLLAAAGIAVAAALVYLTMRINENAKVMEKDNENAKKGVTEGFSRKEMESSDVYKQIQGEKDPEKKKALANKLVMDKQHEMSSAMNAQNDVNNSWWTAVGGNKDDVKKASDRKMEAEKQMKIAMAARNELVNNQKVDIKEPPAVPGAPGAPGHPAAGPGGAAPGKAGDKQTGLETSMKFMQGMMAKMRAEQGPKIGSIEDARKQVQLNALKDPLEQEMIRLQRQYYKNWEQSWPDYQKKLKESGGSVFT
jgi:hypothetical protein